MILAHKITIIDDDPELTSLLASVVEEMGYSCEVYNSARVFLTRHTGDTDIILLDLMMPDIDGIEVMRKLAEQQCDSAIILMSGYDTGVLHSASELAAQHRLQVVATLSKPIMIAAFEQLIAALIESGSIMPAKLSPSEEVLTAAELDAAMQSQQFLLYYQPQIDLRSGALHGVEALIRWQHPQRGLIPPAQFIPLAERENRMGEVTSLVIQQATLQLRLWREMGWRIPISINVSADNITTLQLPEQLLQMLEQHQLDPQLLVIELTESALMKELNTSLDTLTRLRLNAFQLSIDDFGTGYSSLIQLYRAPFTELKIDQHFVFNLSKEREARVIVEICILLGHKLGMRVVAEGVEDAATLTILQELGCDIGQGYHFARPMPPEAFATWLHSGAVPLPKYRDSKV
ncbi:MAG: EAL domain-containing response regulator [Gammaproteobacteria bacterium]|nr:EAL domain-containing response regulator [Gammaproteobacteria bacterium]